jgi:hypothetical protein
VTGASPEATGAVAEVAAEVAGAAAEVLVLDLVPAATGAPVPELALMPVIVEAAEVTGAAADVADALAEVAAEVAGAAAEVLVLDLVPAAAEVPEPEPPPELVLAPVTAVVTEPTAEVAGAAA